MVTTKSKTLSPNLRFSQTNFRKNSIHFPLLFLCSTSMKRFFKPIEKGGSNKRPSLTTASSDNKSNCKEEESTESNLERNYKEPLKLLTWNANSFLLRVKNNWPEFTKLIQTADPDVICIQEVRMPAAGSKGAPKNPSELKDDTSSSREEKQVIMRALASPQFRNYNVWWSLSDSKYAGTALFIKKQFQPKKVSFSLDGTGSKHEPDGRVILAEFESFFILNTYVPNNGWKEDTNSFVRRRKWDKRILEFVLQIKKPLIWCGDLNVSHEEIDVSHPDFFSIAKLNGYIPPNKEDCGQPGFTLAERRRFSNILSQGKLIDAYRYLHKEQDMEKGFSWSGNPVGKYRGKRMRIDYFVLSEQFKNKIVACEMHGQGIELQGFYGSDHCPVSLTLSQMEKDGVRLAKEESDQLAKEVMSQENDQLAKEVILQEQENEQPAKEVISQENDQLGKEVNDPIGE